MARERWQRESGWNVLQFCCSRARHGSSGIKVPPLLPIENESCSADITESIIFSVPVSNVAFVFIHWFDDLILIRATGLISGYPKENKEHAKCEMEITQNSIELLMKYLYQHPHHRRSLGYGKSLPIFLRCDCLAQTSDKVRKAKYDTGERSDHHEKVKENSVTAHKNKCCKGQRQHSRQAALAHALKRGVSLYCDILSVTISRGSLPQCQDQLARETLLRDRLQKDKAGITRTPNYILDAVRINPSETSRNSNNNKESPGERLAQRWCSPKFHLISLWC